MTTPQDALLAILGSSDTRDLPALPATMLVSAHPDDETVCAGSRLRRLAGKLLVCCVTDGAPRTGQDASRHGFSPAQYAQARRRELEDVLARCGIPPERVFSLDAPDQQTALQMAPLARRLADLCVQHGTQVLLTQCYEGGHPDHDATAFIVHAAAALLRKQGREAPALVEMAAYHRGPDGVRACAFLPAPDGSDGAVMLSLSAEEQQHKADLMAAFVTQRDTLRGFPLDAEGFRPAPRYDFCRPPHAGKLHYEHYPWGMSGERFRQLAGEALAQLGLEGPL